MMTVLMQQELLRAKPEQAKISKSPYATPSGTDKIQLFMTLLLSSGLSEGIACFLCV